MFEFDRVFLAYFFVALSTFVVTLTIFNLLAKPIAIRIDVNRRMKLILQDNDRERVFEDLMKSRGLTAQGGYRYPLIQSLSQLILQSGVVIGAEILLAITIGIVGIIFSIIYFYYSLSIVVAFPVSISFGVGGMLAFLALKRKRRQASFALQLPDALELISRSLRAGHPLPVSLTLAAREISDPLGTEFGIFSDELSYGVPLPRALKNLDTRVGQDDLAIFSTAVIIQNEVGGNLIELISNLSFLMRERVKMRRKVRALTAEGRFSGIVLSMLPLIMFAAINALSPGYYGDVWDRPSVKIALIFAVFWVSLGNYIMYRMVNFKF